MRTLSAMMPLIVVSCLALPKTEALVQPAEPGLTPETKLWGHWQSLNGKLSLQIKDDRTAIWEVVGANPDDPLVPSFGEIAVKRGGWILSVTDPAKKVTVYGVALQDTRRLTIADGRDNGELIEFVRCEVPFVKLDLSGDGYLSPEECKGTRITFVFGQCDKNVDKKLDRAEYAIYWLKHAK